MPIDKINSMDAVLNANHGQAQHKVQNKAIEDSVDIGEMSSHKNDPTKISYPPFLPVGDTQGIYRK